MALDNLERFLIGILLNISLLEECVFLCISGNLFKNTNKAKIACMNFKLILLFASESKSGYGVKNSIMGKHYSEREFIFTGLCLFNSHYMIIVLKLFFDKIQKQTVNIEQEPQSL